MMSRAQTVTLYLSVALTSVTGILFAVMKYAMTTDDPFAVVNHPLQPWVLAAHVVVAPLAVFAFGWMFSNHVAPGVANRAARSRRSGLSLVASIAPMIASGYLLQVTTSDVVRKAFAVTHWISSALFVIAFGMHAISAIRKRLRNEEHSEDGANVTAFRPAAAGD